MLPAREPKPSRTSPSAVGAPVWGSVVAHPVRVQGRPARRGCIYSSDQPLRQGLFFLEARIVGGDTLRALKLVKLYPVSLVSRVCDQFCLCKFVECDQPLLTFGRAIVYRKKPPF